MAKKKLLLADQQNTWNNGSVQRKDWELVPVTSPQYKLISNAKVPYVLLNDILQSNLVSITHRNALLQLKYSLLNDLHNAAIEPSKCSLVQNNCCTSEIYEDRQKQPIDSERKRTIKKHTRKGRRSTKKRKLYKEKAISSASDTVDTLSNNVDELKKDSTVASEIESFDKGLMKITIKTIVKRGQRKKGMKVCVGGSNEASTSSKAIDEATILSNQKKVPTVEENSAIPEPATVKTCFAVPGEVHTSDEINETNKVDCTLQLVTPNHDVNYNFTTCDIPSFDCSKSPDTDNKSAETSCRGLVDDCTASQSECTTYNSQTDHSMAVPYDDSNVERKENVTSINYLQNDSMLTEDNVHFGHVTCNDTAILLNNNKEDVITEITHENDLINDFQNGNVETSCKKTSSKNFKSEYEGSYNTLEKRKAPLNSIRRSQRKNEIKKCIVQTKQHFKETLLVTSGLQASDLSQPNGNARKRKTVSEPINNATLPSMPHISNKTECNIINDIKPAKQQRIGMNNLNLQSDEQKSNNSKDQNLQISNKIYNAPLEHSNIKTNKRKIKKSKKKIRKRTASVRQATNQHKKTNSIVQSQEQSNWTPTGNNAEPNSSGNPCIQASEDNFKLSQSNSSTDTSSEISYKSSNELHRSFKNENQHDIYGKNLFGNKEETANVISKVLGDNNKASQQPITPGKADGTESQYCSKRNKSVIKLNRTPCFARSKLEANLPESSLHKKPDNISTSKPNNSATMKSNKTNAKVTRREVNSNKSMLDKRDSFINAKCINSNLLLDNKCNSSNENNNNALIDTLIDISKSINIESETPKSDIKHSNDLQHTLMDTLKSTNIDSETIQSDVQHNNAFTDISTDTFKPTNIDSETPQSDIQHNIVRKKNVEKDSLSVSLLEAGNSTANKKTIKPITEDVKAEQDDSNSDCISLFAGPLDISDCDSIADDDEQITRVKNSEDEYSMTDSNFDAFVKKNKNAFIEEYESAEKDKSNNPNVQSVTREEAILPVETCASVNTQMTNRFLSVNNITHIPMNTLYRDRFIHKRYFMGYCFGQLRRGHCSGSSRCLYEHSVWKCCERFTSMDVNELSRLINSAILYDFKYFVQQLYVQSLEEMKNYLDILQLYKHVYQYDLSSDEIVTHTVKILMNRKMELPLLLEHLSSIIRPNDTETFQSIINIVSPYILPGEYWKTIKTLTRHVAPGRLLTETVLKECVTCQKDPPHIQDVYINLIKRLSPNVKVTLNKDIWNNFTKLLQNRQLDNSTCKTTSRISIGERITEDTIASPDAEQEVTKNLQENTTAASNIGHKSQMQPNDLKSARTSKILQNGEGTPVQCNADKSTSCVGTESNKGTSNSFVVHPVDDIPIPGSVHRERCWKFDCDRNSLQKGLIHEDYDHVIDILEKYASQDHKSLFTHACYHILRREIMHSQHYLTKIIERTGNVYFNTEVT